VSEVCWDGTFSSVHGPLTGWRLRVDVVIRVFGFQEGGVVFTTADAAAALAAVGIDISAERYGLEDVRDGMNVELEHGTRFPDLDVSGDDPVVTLKIAVAHLREFPDYYERLEVMEREGEAAWEAKAGR
jgi:hypothetical protein